MAFITLSRKALYHNLDIIAQRTRSVDKIALVLKDNAYGHGLFEIAQMVSEYGIKRAVVRTQSEAEQLLSYFDYILVLADIPEEGNEKICYTVNSLEEITRFPKGCRVELKVDSGMHRNGIAAEELDEAFEAIARNALRLEAVYTHHRSADTLSSEWFWQKKNFEAVKIEAALLAQKHGFGLLRFHGGNSAALFRTENFEEDMVRIGIAAYGCLQMDITLDQPELKPVLSLWGEKITTRTLTPSQRIGYNGTFRADEVMKVSIYDVGYADGLLRAASDDYVAPNGTALRGRISMDNSVFASEEEQLLIFDNANDFAASAGTIGYEVLTGMRPHLKRQIVD